MEKAKSEMVGNCKGDVVKMKRGLIYHDIRDAKLSFGRALQQAVIKGNKQECAKALLAGIDKLEGINVEKIIVVLNVCRIVCDKDFNLNLCLFKVLWTKCSNMPL